jgi:hypothetical protein
VGLVPSGAGVSDRYVENDVADVSARASYVDALQDRAEFGYEGLTASDSACFFDERAQCVADIVVFQVAVWAGRAGARVFAERVEHSAAGFRILRSVRADLRGQGLLDAKTEAGGGFERVVRDAYGLPVEAGDENATCGRS